MTNAERWNHWKRVKEIQWRNPFIPEEISKTPTEAQRKIHGRLTKNENVIN